jgi:hypothetical protein
MGAELSARLTTLETETIPEIKADLEMADNLAFRLATASDKHLKAQKG